MCKTHILSEPTLRQRGFTLIELMIAVAVVAILASIALPSYQDQVRKSRRGDAQSFATDVVARQQQFLLDRRTYAVSITDAPAANGLGLAVPTSVTPFYRVTIATDNSAPPTFTVTLTPLGAQANDTCGTLTITAAGKKAATGTGKCW